MNPTERFTLSEHSAGTWRLTPHAPAVVHVCRGQGHVVEVLQMIGSAG